MTIVAVGSVAGSPGATSLVLGLAAAWPDATRTRVFARSRMGRHPSIGSRLAYFGFWEPAHFVMERRMLLTIKQLAESSAPGQPEPTLAATPAAPERAAAI